MGNVNNVMRAPVEEQREPETKADANGGPAEEQREREPKDDVNGAPPEISVLPIPEDEDDGIECDSTTNLLSGLGKSVSSTAPPPPFPLHPHSPSSGNANRHCPRTPTTEPPNT